MFRRIEFIYEPVDLSVSRLDKAYKTGIMGYQTDEIADAWIYALRGPDSSIPWNARFYFTEKGWRKVGHNVAAACRHSGQEYRVIKIKENAIDVVYRNEYEVAGQPVRAWRRERRKRGKFVDTD
jgi:hypothetical protein